MKNTTNKGLLVNFIILFLKIFKLHKLFEIASVRSFLTYFCQCMKALSEQEIHQLAMQEVGGFLEAEGYEFLAVNSEMKRSPQFVCVKDKVLYFVVVEGCLYPKSPKTYDEERMGKVKIHAEKNMKILFLFPITFPKKKI